MGFNAHSLINKDRRDLLELGVQYQNFDILIISETWWQKELPDSILHLSNYLLASRSDRKSPDNNIHGGGGVAIYVKRGIKYHSTSNFNIQDYAQIAGLKIKDLQIVGIYRKPGDDINLDQRVCEVISSKYTSDKIIIAGDVNLPHTNWEKKIYPSRPAKKWGELVHQMALTQLITEPTQDIGNQLDCFFVRSSHDCSASDVEVDRDLISFSDHFCTSVNLEVIVRREPQEKEVLDEKRINWEDYELKTKEYGIIAKIDSQNDAFGKWSEVMNCLLTARNSTCPKKVVKLGKSPVWINPHIQRMLRKDQRLRSLSKLNANSHLKRKRIFLWKKHHNVLKKKVKQSRDDYEIKKVNNYQKDSKSLFRDMKLARGSGTRELPVISPDGAPLISDQEKAQAFQDRFLTVYSNPISDTNIDWPQEWGLNDVEFTVKDVKCAIKELKPDSSPGNDQLGPKYYKHCDFSVILALVTLYNFIFQNCDIPIDFLNSMVIPIWKNKGSMSDLATYRQITLLCTAFKIMESIIIKKIKAHLSNFGLNDYWQHGFQAQKSTITNLMTSWDYISKTVDEGGGAICISLDFSNAFDSLDINQLLLALKSKGIGGKLGAFLQTWLKGRTQFVRVNEGTSSSGSCPSGIPQGSHGGPAYFCILLSYVVNNLPLDGAETEINLKIISFADDTRVSFEVKNEHQHSIAQKVLNIMSTAFKSAGLKLNASKSVMVIYGKEMYPKPYQIDGAEVEVLSQSLELGCIFSNNMSFKCQIERNVSKAAAFVFMIRNSMKSRNFYVLNKLYMTYYIPIVTYASQIWAGDYVYVREMLYASFRNFWRLGNGYITPNDDVMDPYQITLKNNFTLLFQILKGENCLSQSNIFDYVQGVTRSVSNVELQVQRNKTRTRDAFFTTNVAKMYNDLPLAIRQSQSTSLFKTRIKEHIKIAFKRLYPFDYRPLHVRFSIDNRS